MTEQIVLMLNYVEIKVLTLDTGLLRKLDKFFTYRDPSTIHNKQLQTLKRQGAKIETDIKFFNLEEQTVPIGFLEELTILLEECNYKVTIQDLRDFPQITIPNDYDDLFKGIKVKRDDGAYEEIKLRYYQKECLDAIVKEKNYCGIIEGATGFGKTLTFLTLCKMIPGRILIIFPGKQLVFQTKKVATDYRVPNVGLVSGESVLIGKRIMLCNYQSLEKLEAYDDFSTFNTVIVDEMHTAKAATTYNVLQRLPSSIRLGFSATAFKIDKDDESLLDNARNKANFGEMIYTKPEHELIAEGFLSQLNINIIPITEPQDSSVINHMEAIDKLLVNNMYRNKIIKDLAEETDDITLIMVSRREHGEILSNMIKDCKYVHGETPMQDRERLRKELNLGKIKRCVNTSVWFTGIDLPNLKRLIICGSGKSFYQTIQRIGRGLRKTKTKLEVEVYDFDDQTNQSFLKKWSDKRIKYYLHKQYNVVFHKKP